MTKYEKSVEYTTNIHLKSLIFIPAVVDHCQNNPCENGGTCRGYRYGYYCRCTEEYTGRNCTFGKILIHNVTIR